MIKITKFHLSLLLIQLVNVCVFSLPLSTNSKWIVDDANGKRVKFKCVNWPSHLQPMIAEGLEKKPLEYLAKQVSELGFNCVRFTYATFMFTRANYMNLTVAQSLDRLGLEDAKAGVAKNNPKLLNVKVVEAHKAVVRELGANNVMVVLDNHVSEPEWCCSDNDGNGFFGDSNFDPQEWLQGLTVAAQTYKDVPTVVAMSMRNELRGPRQNVADWYRYMQEGATTIHRENANVLVIVSGLYTDTNLSFLRRRPFGVENHLDNKLVFELHRYSFGTSAEKWRVQTNKLCADYLQTFENNFLFLGRGNDSFPLFISEFGIDQRGRSEADNRYIGCLLASMAENDLDWALWTLQGSYILREGHVDENEVYGVLDFDWDRPRNPAFLDRLQLIGRMNQDPKSSRQTAYILYHPLSGQCVQYDENVVLTNCESASKWEQHQDDGLLQLTGGGPRCLGVAGDGASVRVSNDCASKWKLVSSSKLQLATQNGQGGNLCLEKNSADSTIVAKKCLCVGDDLADLPTCSDNPEIQWFKIVPTNV